ncbi:L-iditol 2-dehydrogenase domain protein [Burkholderia pseudomallei MSHR2990]|nr:L-iditol 2-dehydrogenase domain protein [Burkholderia pseudomallei MSHR2990]
MRDDALRRDEPAREQIDRDRIAIRAEMRAAHVELLAIADDRPVERRILAEHRELDEAAELADQRHALRDARRHAGRLDVDVAAVAPRQRAHDRGRVLAGRIDRHVGAVCARERAARFDGIDDDEPPGRLQLRDLRHHQAERARARDHDDVVELDVAAIDRVDRARERLDDRRVLERDAERDRVDDRARRYAHVLGHPAVGDLALKAEDVMDLAHPVLARLAIAARAARHDLLGDHAIAERDAEVLGRALAQRLDVAEELVAGNHGCLDPRARPAPEHLRAGVALAVARADAARADADHELARVRARLRDALDAVVLGGVADDRRHLLRFVVSIRHGFGLAGWVRENGRPNAAARARMKRMKRMKRIERARRAPARRARASPLAAAPRPMRATRPIQAARAAHLGPPLAAALTCGARGRCRSRAG